MPRGSSFPSGPRILGFRSASAEASSRRDPPTIRTTFRRRKASRWPSPTSRSRTRRSPATGPWSPESRMRLDSARGLFHTADGTVPLAEADRDACGCPACAAGEDLGAHNDRALFREMLLVRNHLVHGRLRELVERRLANAPWNTAVVRHLDLREYDLVEPYTPVPGR